MGFRVQALGRLRLLALLRAPTRSGDFIPRARIR